MYDPTTIFLIVWDLFIVVLFLLLGFLPGEVPLAFVVKLAWWHWILLTFACLERFWFLHQIWTRVLLGRIFLVVRFFPFIALNTLCHSLLACRVSIEKSADNLMGVPLYVINICHFPPFNVLNLSLIFVSEITILPGTLCASWIWLSVSTSSSCFSGVLSCHLGLPWWLNCKEHACNVGNAGSIPGPGRNPEEGNGYPCLNSCLENSIDRGNWWARVHRVAESDKTERLTSLVSSSGR